MDIQDLKQESRVGNRYLLVVVDRTSKFLFEYLFVVLRNMTEMIHFILGSSIYR